MKNKSILLVAITAALFSMASYTVLKTAGAHPGSTGAPGDLTCAQAGCHTDATVTNDFGTVNKLTFSNSDSTYTPGETYTLTIKVTHGQTQKFGFELQALKDSDNTNIGLNVLLDAARTQEISHALGADMRYSMTHQPAGTQPATPGTIQWTMGWTAPDHNAGPITFYYATNCTNNNGLNSGDRLFLSSFKIKPANTTGIKEENLSRNFNLSYNSELHSLRLRFTSETNQQTQFAVFDINGKLVMEQRLQLSVGEQDQKIRLPDNLAKGAYIVRLGSSPKAHSGKIIID